MWLELEGVLVKAVQGLQRAMARGSYLESPNCKRALKVYSKQVMDVESFIDEMLFEFPGEVIPQSELYQAYRTYCRHIDVNPKTVIAFNKNFKKETAGRIIERQITGGIDVYEGFALQPFGGVSM
jgi:phage/plasmid-associated DNA primase